MSRSLPGREMNGLQFTVSGTGAVPLICVHGWGCESGQFAGLSRALEEDFRIFCPDLPGHGRTPLEGFQPGFLEYAGALAEFVEGQEIKNPILIGHSMGGVLSLIAAERLQPRAVINLDGSLPASEKTLAALQTMRSWLDLPDFRQKLAGALRENYFLPSECDARCEAIIRGMCSAPDAVLRFLPERTGDLDPAAILSKVTAPTLYVGAAFPRFDFEKVNRSNIQFERIAGAGHFLQIYGLDQLVPMVKKFLRAALCKGTEE